MKMIVCRDLETQNFCAQETQGNGYSFKQKDWSRLTTKEVAKKIRNFWRKTWKHRDHHKEKVRIILVREKAFAKLPKKLLRLVAEECAPNESVNAPPLDVSACRYYTIKASGLHDVQIIKNN